MATRRPSRCTCADCASAVNGWTGTVCGGNVNVGALRCCPVPGDTCRSPTDCCEAGDRCERQLASADRLEELPRAPGPVPGRLRPLLERGGVERRVDPRDLAREPLPVLVPRDLGRGQERAQGPQALLPRAVEALAAEAVRAGRVHDPAREPRPVLDAAPARGAVEVRPPPGEDARERLGEEPAALGLGDGLEEG